MVVLLVSLARRAYHFQQSASSSTPFHECRTYYLKSGNIETQGKVVKSKQTGFDITLPGKKVATVSVIQLFGDNETNEGAITSISSGSIDGLKYTELNVVEAK